MDYELELPDPLRYRIAEWQLPDAVELKFYEMLDQKLRELYHSEATKAKTYEMAICDPESGLVYCFAGRAAAKKYKGKFVIVDCDFDFFIEPQSHDEPTH